MLKVQKKNGFSLMETLITIVIVGMLSTVCGTMLIFAYSMFEKIMGNGTASIEYKMFRFRTEKIFRNMTSEGPLVMDLITGDVCSTHGSAGRPPVTAEEEDECIKFDLEYVLLPYDLEVYTIKYNQPRPAKATTKYEYYDNATFTWKIDLGQWEGNVGRSVAVYSCVEPEKEIENYKRYLMRMEVDPHTNKKIVVLYTWPVDPNVGFVSIPNEAAQEAMLPNTIPNPWNLTTPTREVLLSDVKDFQVTARLSNLYFNRVKYAKYANNALVRIYIKLGEDSDAQYSNDLIFANKSIYGDIDNNFFVSFDYTRIKP